MTDMSVFRRRRGAVAGTEHVIDRMVANVEHGRFEPPISAPGLMSMVGGMGLLAAVLRREK